MANHRYQWVGKLKPTITRAVFVFCFLLTGGQRRWNDCRRRGRGCQGPSEGSRAGDGGRSCCGESRRHCRARDGHRWYLQKTACPCRLRVSVCLSRDCLGRSIVFRKKTHTERYAASAGTIEAEGHDRANTTLPGTQPELVKSVLALGKPTVLVPAPGSIH